MPRRSAKTDPLPGREPVVDPPGGERHAAVITVPPVYITIPDFCRMVAKKSRGWFYQHANDPDMPKRYYGRSGETVLRYDECVAYAEATFSTRIPLEERRARKERLRRETRA